MLEGFAEVIAKLEAMRVELLAKTEPADTQNVNIVSGSGSGVTHVDDAAFAPATDDVVPIAGVFDDAAPDSVDEGDAGAVRMSANRNLYMRIRDNAGNERGANVDASGNLNVIAARNSGVDIGDGTLNNAAGGSAVNVQDGGNSLTVDNTVLSVVGGGTEATAQRVTIATDSTGVLSVDDNGGNLSIDDGGNSITVDNTVLSVVGGGTEATAQRVTIATDSTGVLSVDDNGSSLTVDGSVTALLSTTSLSDAGTALTPKFAKIDAATSGDNTLVSAVNPKKLRVVAAFLVAGGTVDVRFESGASGTALTGQMSLVANAGFVLPFNPVGWFETASNTLLNLELSGAVSVDGCLTYLEV